MRNLILLFTFIVSVSEISSQEVKPKFNEIDLSINSITNLDFGIDYKTSFNSNTLLRLELFNFDFKTTENDPANPSLFKTNHNNLQSNIGIGIEKRKTLSDKLNFYTGIDILLNVYWDRLKTDNPFLSENLRTVDALSLNPGLGFKTGLHYKLNNDLSIGFSFSPHVYFRYLQVGTSFDSKEKEKEGNININLDEISLSIIYRWNK